MVEQITKPLQNPLPITKEKIKNPKKVAARKKLAEYNKKAKEKQSEKEKETPSTFSFLPETSFTIIIALVGLVLTAIDLFLRYKSDKCKQSNDFVAVESNDIDAPPPFRRLLK